MYTHIHIYLQLCSFWFCLNLPPHSLAEARPFLPFSSQCASTTASALGVGVVQMFLTPWWSSACLSGQVSGIPAGQFSQSHKICECCGLLTSFSSCAVTAMSGACCRPSAASLLCDLPTERHGKTRNDQA